MNPRRSAEQKFSLCPEGIFQIKAVDTQLVGHDHIHVVRHAAGDPVVAADGLQPPDLVHVAEKRCRSSRKYRTAPAGCPDAARPRGRSGCTAAPVHDILLADAAGHLGLFALGGLILHQRVAPSTRGLEVIVSVAVMPTLAALTPEAAQMPLPSTALGIAVNRRAPSGRGISTWRGRCGRFWAGPPGGSR